MAASGRSQSSAKDFQARTKIRRLRLIDATLSEINCPIWNRILGQLIGYFQQLAKDGSPLSLSKLRQFINDLCGAHIGNLRFETHIVRFKLEAIQRRGLHFAAFAATRYL